MATANLITLINKKLIAKDKLTVLIKANGINTWAELIVFVKNLPYGRNANRADFELVISEKKGSCSSKHALLKKVATSNAIPNIKLILGIYKMNKINTPNIGNVLFEKKVAFIPEAHCYLKINDKRIDITTFQSNFEKIEKDIIQEIEIRPEQVTAFKIQYHKRFLKNWISENKIEMNFSELWEIREKCVANLIEKSGT